MRARIGNREAPVRMLPDCLDACASRLLTRYAHAASACAWSAEAVAHAARRRDALRPVFGAKAAHVDLDDVRAGIEVEPPDLAEKRLPAEELLPAADLFGLARENTGPARNRGSTDPREFRRRRGAAS